MGAPMAGIQPSDVVDGVRRRRRRGRRRARRRRARLRDRRVAAVAGHGRRHAVHRPLRGVAEGPRHRPVRHQRQGRPDHRHRRRVARARRRCSARRPCAGRGSASSASSAFGARRPVLVPRRPAGRGRASASSPRSSPRPPASARCSACCACCGSAGASGGAGRRPARRVAPAVPDLGRRARRARRRARPCSGAGSAAATSSTRRGRRPMLPPPCRRRRRPRRPPADRRRHPRASPGLSPYITPNADFYRIDTALVVPQVDVADWALTIEGVVDNPFELTYDELVAMADFADTVTLQCVSNEVGGNLVGNAMWQGVRLATLLERAGVQPGGHADRRPVGRRLHGRVPDRGRPRRSHGAGRGRHERRAAAGRARLPGPARRRRAVRLRVGDEVAATRSSSTTWEDFDGYWVPRGWSKEGPIKMASRIDVPRSGGALDAGQQAIAGVAWEPTLRHRPGRGAGRRRRRGWRPRSATPPAATRGCSGTWRGTPRRASTASGCGRRTPPARCRPRSAPTRRRTARPGWHRRPVDVR